MLMPVYYAIGQILLLFAYLDGNVCQDETNYILNFLNSYSAGPFEENQLENAIQLKPLELDGAFYSIIDVLSSYPEISIDFVKLCILELMIADGKTESIEITYYHRFTDYLKENYHPEDP